MMSLKEGVKYSCADVTNSKYLGLLKHANLDKSYITYQKYMYINSSKYFFFFKMTKVTNPFASLKSGYCTKPHLD